jgi:hypothetical protein
LALVTVLVKKSLKAILYYTGIVSASHNYPQWIKMDLLVFIAYIVGLKKLVKVLVLIQQLLEAVEDAVMGEAGKSVN